MDPRGTLVDLGLPPGEASQLTHWPHWSWAECRLEVALQSWEDRDLEPKVMTSIPASTASPKVGGPAWGPGRLCSPDAPEPRLPLP